MKRILLILLPLFVLSLALPGCAASERMDIVYGVSEAGRDLTCVILAPERSERTILMTFAMHGFEDGYARDGRALVNAAEQLIDYFSVSEPGCRLMIVPCANPDGLLEGKSADGFGRCAKSGVDINRDFDVQHVVKKNTRNRSLSPFSTAESRALRDLVLEYAPDIVIDCHGWLGYSVGNEALGRFFEREIGLRYRCDFSERNGGSFALWASAQGAKAMLLEFPHASFDRERFIHAVERLASDENIGLEAAS